MFKTSLIILIFFLLTSCATVKTKSTDREVINTYLQSVVYDKNYPKIFIAEEPRHGKESIEVYETALREKDLEPSHLRQIWHAEMDTWPLDKKEIAILKNKIQDEKAKPWSIDDFNNNKIIIKEGKTIDSDFRLEHLFYGKNVLIYLSKPIYSNDKQYVLFECVIWDAFHTGGPAKGSGVVLMEKKNGNWKLITLFNRAIYY